MHFNVIHYLMIIKISAAVTVVGTTMEDNGGACGMDVGVRGGGERGMDEEG